VDRFQGDENDIVIYSLVRVAGGNPFLALHNRFVVAGMMIFIERNYDKVSNYLAKMA
jgi:hypothetical protein